MRYPWIILLFISANAYSYDYKKCWKTYTGSAWYKSYNIKYSAWGWESYKTSSKEGTTKTSSASSTQNSTMGMDPGVTITGSFASSSQLTSSTGNCRLFGALHENREAFIAQNLYKLKEEIAYGKGDLVFTLARLSGCPLGHSTQFARLMQKNYETLAPINNFEQSFSLRVDSLLEADPVLNHSCLAGAG